jgi:hypothetical protein
VRSIIGIGGGRGTGGGGGGGSVGGSGFVGSGFVGFGFMAGAMSCSSPAVALFFQALGWPVRCGRLSIGKCHCGKLSIGKCRSHRDRHGQPFLAVPMTYRSAAALFVQTRMRFFKLFPHFVC